jgi:hypothetical protein
VDLNDTNRNALQLNLNYPIPRVFISGIRIAYIVMLFRGRHCQDCLKLYRNDVDISILLSRMQGLSSEEFLEDIVADNKELMEPDLSVLNVNLVGCMYTGKLALWWFKQNPTPGGALVMISNVGGNADGAPLTQLTSNHAL